MAEQKYLVDINLNQNELKKPVLENQGIAPENPKDGQIYYATNTGAKGVKVYKTGTTSAWKKLLDEDDTANFVTTSRKINNKGLSSDITLYGTDITLSSTDTTTTLTAALENCVVKNATITGATKCKITYDLQGLVTAGADLQANDIPNLASSKITAMTGYVKGNSTSAITTTDSLNTAIGKLEKGLEEKQATITGAATTVVSNDLTANRALVSDNSGKISISEITATELGYLDGVTANIQNQIDALENRGRFLSIWNSTTGLPTTNPGTLPYEYKTGDYFIVGFVGTTNYKPTGSAYNGTASTVVETATVAVNDTYYYDGTKWLLQVNTVGEVTFASITGNPTDNTNLANALNAKAPLASPALTGTPTAPTAATGTNTTQVATTAFVQDAISSLSVTLTATNTALTQSGGICTWTISNTLNNDAVSCTVREVSTGERVVVNDIATTSTITIKFNSSSDIAAGTYKAIIQGQQL